MQYTVKAESLTGSGLKTFKAGDIVEEMHFTPERMKELLANGFIEEKKEPAKPVVEPKKSTDGTI